MFIEFFTDIGAWGWVLTGFVLLAIEIIAPGYFLLWIGSAALLVGVIGLIGLQSNVWWTPPMQFVAFAIFSVVAILVGRRFYDPLKMESEEPLLNQRAVQLIGKKAIILDPIINGVGRAKVGDTIWKVEGPDTQEGAVMRVAATDGDVLTLEAQ